MNSIDDDTVRFWLAHHRQIDEWAALRAGANQAMVTFLRSVSDDLPYAIDDSTAQPAGGESSGYTRSLLRRSHWPADGDEPWVGVGLSWHRTVNFRSAVSPFVGIYAPTAAPIGPPPPGLHDLRTDLPDYESASGWPLWRWVRTPDGDGYLDDLDPYRKAILDAVSQLWAAAASLLDRWEPAPTT